jgi:hypothetical protein
MIILCLQQYIKILLGGLGTLIPQLQEYLLLGKPHLLSHILYLERILRPAHQILQLELHIGTHSPRQPVLELPRVSVIEAGVDHHEPVACEVDCREQFRVAGLAQVYAVEARDLD